jgi:hypothetical protein
MIFGQGDLRRLYGDRPHAGTRIDNVLDGELSRPASCGGHYKNLANHFRFADRFLRHEAIRIQNQTDGFPQIDSNLVERLSLSICSRKFLDEANVPLGNLHEYGGKLQSFHRFSLAVLQDFGCG